MDQVPRLTRHARHRAEQRLVPHPIISLILEYGECREARGGARKFALSKSSLSALRRDLGARASKGLDRYRKAYAVASEGRVITVVFSRRSLFH